MLEFQKCPSYVIHFSIKRFIRIWFFILLKNDALYNEFFFQRKLNRVCGRKGSSYTFGEGSARDKLLTRLVDFVWFPSEAPDSCLYYEHWNTNNLHLYSSLEWCLSELYSNKINAVWRLNRYVVFCIGEEFQDSRHSSPRPKPNCIASVGMHFRSAPF